MRKKIDYRAMVEAELSDRERAGIYGKQSAAEWRRGCFEDLVSPARRDRQGFDKLARWLVVTCRVGRENDVSDSLSAAEIECWCPRERLKARPRRGLQAVDIFRPIFRGYLFVRVVPDSLAYAGLLATGKVRGLMYQDGKPYVMPETLMRTLMLAALESERKQKDVNELPPLPDLLNKRVVIRSGPFADFAVTVRKLLAKRRQVVVDVPMFGGMKEVELGVDSIRLSD